MTALAALLKIPGLHFIGMAEGKAAVLLVRRCWNASGLHWLASSAPKAAGPTAGG
jgi:hypothetical protein